MSYALLIEKNHINKLQKNKQDWKEVYNKMIMYWEK